MGYVSFREGTLPETNIFAPENGWLEDDPFLVGCHLFLRYHGIVAGYTGISSVGRKTNQGNPIRKNNMSLRLVLCIHDFSIWRI